MTKTMLKGSPAYSVSVDGVEIARAHCVNVKANLFTLIIRGRWAGVVSEVKAVAALESLSA